MRRTMSQQLGGQPILILREGTTRNRGQEAQNSNFAAAKAVASAVRSTLGPKGMDKMLIDSMGDITITNDGVTILKEMDIEHPAGKMMVEIAKTQDAEVGDGTTTAVVIAGELLKNAEGLLTQSVHPTVIAEGYRLAAEKALVMLDGFAMAVKPTDTAMLKRIAEDGAYGQERRGFEGSSLRHYREERLHLLPILMEKWIFHISMWRRRSAVQRTTQPSSKAWSSIKNVRTRICRNP